MEYGGRFGLMRCLGCRKLWWFCVGVDDRVLGGGLSIVKRDGGFV